MSEMTSRPTFCIITGGSASGKTTVAKLISKQIINLNPKYRVFVLSQDSFYKNLSDEEIKKANNNEYNFDHFSAIDVDEMESIMSKLNKRIPVKIYDYDFSKHAKSGKYTEIGENDIIIVEGIHTLFHKCIRKYATLKVFVDTRPDIRLIRRIKRDINERGREIHGVLDSWIKYVEPGFQDFTKPSKRYADIIVPNIEGNINLISINTIASNLIN